jgi:hypothetical protein
MNNPYATRPQPLWTGILLAAITGILAGATHAGIAWLLEYLITTR